MVKPRASPADAPSVGASVTPESALMLRPSAVPITNPIAALYGIPVSPSRNQLRRSRLSNAWGLAASARSPYTPYIPAAATAITSHASSAANPKTSTVKIAPIGKIALFKVGMSILRAARRHLAGLSDQALPVIGTGESRAGPHTIR